MTLGLAAAILLGALQEPSEAEALRNRLERREKDVEYIEQRIQDARAKGHLQELGRLQEERDIAIAEVRTLRRQLRVAEVPAERRRDHDEFLPRLSMRLDWGFAILPHSLRLGNEIDPGDDSGAGLATGFTFAIRSMDFPLTFSYRNLDSFDNATDRDVEVQGYLLGMAADFELDSGRETVGLEVLTSAGLVNFRATGGGGPSTDSGPMIAIEARFVVRLGSGLHFTFGSNVDAVWTDFNQDGTSTYLLWGLRAGFEFRF
jgi:hypothetical protein